MSKKKPAGRVASTSRSSSRASTGTGRSKASRSSMSRAINIAEKKKAGKGPQQKISRVPGTGAGKKPTAANPHRDAAIAVFLFAQKLTEKYAGVIPNERATAQASPAVNHALWTYGHLAVTNDWVATLIDGKPSALPSNYNALFGMESTPVDDPNQYPSFADIRTAYTRAGQRLVNAVKTLDDSQLGNPPKGEGYGFVNSFGDGILKAAWHEGWHLGQIADLRRGLGITVKGS